MMSKAAKIWLIVAASLTFVGLVIFGGTIFMLNFDFTNFTTGKFETNEHVITESYESIYVDTNTAHITFLPSEDGTTSVTCYEIRNQRHTVSVNDGTLSVKFLDTRKWYEHIHIGIWWDTPKITVYLPEGEYASLVINEHTGDIDVPKDFKFGDINVSASTGDVYLCASATGSVEIETSTGDIIVNGISAGSLDLSVTTGAINVSAVVCEGEFELEVDTGKAKLTDVSCKSFESDGDTGDLTLENVFASGEISIERDTGDVIFSKCDASAIYVETSTGDVKGTFLSDKIFFAQSNTGKIRVPKSTSGGVCEIKCSTGDIDIDIVTE